ncbi:GldG family protein [Leadbettera azotonutricia]|uniref:GldG family protein n=1 Tax=Leadbettera azotonutricia TaxID=150829 RepID=UPI000303F073|nr:Gldg family protein [Leadbettera azotonutricia]
MTKKQINIIAILSVAAFVLAFMLSSRIWFRLDLTKNKAYTISEVSRNLYKEIPDPVSITYYISDRLARAHPLPEEISDLLREYAAHSRGKIRFTQRDPIKANLAGLMEELGIAPQQIQVVENNETTVATVYTGVTIEYLEKRAVLPVVFSLDTLEYDLTSRIRSLVLDREREIGIIVGSPAKQWNTEFGYLNQELAAAGYKIRLIAPGDEIPASLPSLFVLGGAADLDAWALYRIDHYIQTGGKTLFALEGISVNTQSGLEAGAVADQGLFAMVANYGAVIRPAMVLDTSALQITFQIRSGNVTQYRTMRYPEWIGVLEQNGNKNHAVTARFKGIDLYWPSPLELKPPAGVQAEPLFTSTPEAWLQTKDFITNPDMLSLAEQEAGETRGTKILGASLQGGFPSAFRGSPKPIREGSEEILPDLPPVPSPSRIIVIGDTDFAGNFMQVSRGEDRNLSFLLNAADWLSSDDDIISIRSRQGEAGRLNKIQDAKKKAAAMNFSKGLNVFAVPLLVVTIGLFLSIKRRNEQKSTKGDNHDL